MTAADITSKYENLYKDILRKGRVNKINLLLWVIPGALYAFRVAENHYFSRNLQKEFSYESLIVVSVAFYIFINILAISTDTRSFVRSKTLNRYRQDFKKDFFTLIQKSCPELTSLQFHKKIHHTRFTESGLFGNKFSDYNGDDLFKGMYKDVCFELCELDVISSWFKRIFSGIFIRCKLAGLVETGGEHVSRMEEITLFNEKYKSQVKISCRGNYMYIAINMKGDFFENSRLHFIRRIAADAELMEDIMKILRAVINKVNDIKPVNIKA